MPPSILESCDLLTGLGYSVLIVSNGPLQLRARADLLPHVWRVLERPNLGYDFGGYREAVMHLWDENLDPDELLILNDSVWIVASVFPLFLERLGEMDADVSGSVLRSKKGKRWIESYFYRFQRSALSSQVFREFWRNYRLVDSKFGVIRHGERDFSVSLAAGGLKLAAMGDNEAFMARMYDTPNEEIRIALTYGAPATGAMAEDRSRLLADTSSLHWRTRALAHIGLVLSRGRVWNSAFSVAGLRVMGYPFIKKIRELVNAEWRGLVLSAADEGILPPLSTSVRQEIEAQQALGTTTRPHWQSVPIQNA